MTSLMKRHQAKVMASENRGAETEPYSAKTSMANQTNATKRYELMLSSVHEDCKRLSALNSLEERQALKAKDILPQYEEYIRDYMDSGLNHPNEVLTQCIIWLFDVEKIELALEISLFAIAQDQALPERFNRDLKTFVSDEVFKWAEAEVKNNKSPEPYFTQVFTLIKEKEWVVHEAVQMKFYKLAGLWAEQTDALEHALAMYKQAEKVDPKKAKVKTRISSVEKRLAEQAE